MSTFARSSSSQEPSLTGPLDFKISHPTQKYARRIHFPSPPTYPLLSSKILSLWPSPSLTSSSLALDYVDREGDRVVLSSDEELQAFYHELGSEGKGKEVGVVKMRVVVLEVGKKQEEEGIKGGGGGGGTKVELPTSKSLDLASYNVAGGLPCPAWPKSIAEKKSEEENDRGAEKEKEKEVVVVVEKSQPGTVAVESDLESAAPASSEYSPDKEVERLLAIVAAKEEPTAKFGEQSVVGRGGLPLPQTPPGRGFARFYGGQTTSHQLSSPPTYRDTGSFKVKRDEQEKQKGGE